MAVLFHVFNYKGWKLVYSGPVYIAVYGLNILVLQFVQKFVTVNRTEITEKLSPLVKRTKGLFLKDMKV